MQLRDKNTQVCEQKNSLYVQKRAQFYAMSQFMFLFHLRYYTYERAQRNVAVAAGCHVRSSKAQKRKL